MEWSAWKSVKSDGSIPDDLLPCTLFQLRWNITWLLSSPDDSYTETVKGKWRWVIKQNETPEFESEVRVKATAIWLLGSLVTWYVDPNATEVRTTIPVKPSILGADINAWTQRDDGTWANPAEPGYTISDYDPNSGLGMANDIPVYIDYYSAAYEIPLSYGAKISVPFHNVGGVWTVKLASISIRTAGLGGFDTMFDQVGIYRMIKPENQRARQYVSRDGGTNFEEWRTPMRLTAPSVAKFNTNDLLLGGKIAEAGWGFYTSQNDGLTWSELKLVWESTYSDVRFITTHDDAIVTIARSSGVLYCRTSRDNFTSTIQIGPATNAFELACEQATGKLIADNGSDIRYVSLNGGIGWGKL